MSDYIKPQVVIRREFRAIPSAITDPLRAVILGGQAGLHRYGVASEKAGIALGTYDPTSGSTHSWPSKTVGSVIDLDYAKLYVEGALLRYYLDPVGSGGTVAPVASYPNRIRSSVSAFADNGDYERDAELLRPAKVGDTVRVAGTVSGTPYELLSYIKSFKGDPIAAVTGAAAAAASNLSTQSVATSIDQIAGPKNNLTLTAYAAAFTGLRYGNVNETYTVEVVNGSTDGDLTTATLRVSSASGNDDVASLVPEGIGGSTPIGTQGLYVEFDLNATASGSSAAGLDDAAPNDLVAGQRWTVSVQGGFTAPTVASSGTYTGTKDTTYIAEVVVGGGYGASPKIKVTTTTGIDVSGPTVVTASGVSVAAGSKGVRLTFTGGSGLRKGDKWTVAVTAAKESYLRTIELGHNLPTALQGAADLSLELFMKKNLLIGRNRLGAAPLTNYEASQTEVVVASGITYLDPEWVDGNGDPVPLDLRGGSMYMEYREWLSDFVGTVGAVSTTADAAVLGTVHPDNPIAFGVDLALKNGGGSEVRFIGVSDPSETDNWSSALEVLAGKDDVYNLAPMTHDETVLQLCATHVASSSNEETGLYRGLFVNLPYKATKALVSESTSDDGEPVLATLADDPDTSGTQYTLLTITSGNAALLEAGVRPKDVVRYLYSTDGFGNDEYYEFPIEDVINETTVRLSAAHTVAIATAQKIEVWRPLRRTEIAQDVADRAVAYGSSRVCATIPDQFPSGGVTVPGYFLSAILAGLRGGAAPHQPLTHVALQGIDNVDRVTDLFTESDLNLMAGQGVWIVTKNKQGVIYTRHAVTTDPTSIDTREESVRTNLDSISSFINRYLQGYIGKFNVTPQTLSILQSQVDAALEYLKAQNGASEGIGPQVIAATIVELRASLVAADEVVIRIDLVIPRALNVIRVNLVI